MEEMVWQSGFRSKLCVPSSVANMHSSSDNMNSRKWTTYVANSNGVCYPACAANEEPNVDFTGCVACPAGEVGPVRCVPADVCGVPNGDGSSCLGCDGVHNSGLENDACGVCDGDGKSCAPACPGSFLLGDACRRCSELETDYGGESDRTKLEMHAWYSANCGCV